MEVCPGMAPHPVGSDRACLYCAAHNAIERMQNRPFATVEQWAEKVSGFIVGQAEWDQTKARHLTPAEPRSFSRALFSSTTLKSKDFRK